MGRVEGGEGGGDGRGLIWSGYLDNKSNNFYITPFLAERGGCGGSDKIIIIILPLHRGYRAIVSNYCNTSKTKKNIYVCVCVCFCTLFSLSKRILYHESKCRCVCVCSSVCKIHCVCVFLFVLFSICTHVCVYDILPNVSLPRSSK